MYKNLLTVKNDSYFIDSYTIADKTGNNHNGVIQLIEKYINQVSFEMRLIHHSVRSQNIRIALLTEKQATFLMTLFRNNEIVVRFKEKLVDAFYEAREKIKAQNREAFQWDNASLSKLLITAGKELDKKNLIIQQLKPKAEFYDTVVKTDKWLDFEEACKILANGMGRVKLYNYLRKRKVIMSYCTRPYQQYVDKGYFKIVEKPYLDRHGNDRLSNKTVVSQRGLDFIMRLFKREERKEGG